MGKKYYAVKKGVVPGIYTQWEQCKSMVNGYPGAEYKSFATIEEADEYMNPMKKTRKFNTEKNMEEMEKQNKKLMALYSIGSEIHEGLKEKGTENKLDGYVYKMLNCVKTGNKKEFMDNVIRLHMALGKDISPIFLDVMKEEQFDFATIGHSFLSGLASNKYEKKETNSNETMEG